MKPPRKPRMKPQRMWLVMRPNGQPHTCWRSKGTAATLAAAYRRGTRKDYRVIRVKVTEDR